MQNNYVLGVSDAHFVRTRDDNRWCLARPNFMAEKSAWRRSRQIGVRCGLEAFFYTYKGSSIANEINMTEINMTEINMREKIEG